MRTRISTFVLPVALAFLLPAAALAQESQTDRPVRLVTTTGESAVNRAPDQAWVTVGVEARAANSQQAQQQAAGVMTAIQKALLALGIPEEHIRTVAFNLQADWDYSNNRRTLRGYVVTNQVQVRVDDITKVADVLDKSIAAGGNTIHGVQWDIKDRDAAEHQALADAVRDARARAEAAVAAAGATLGEVVTIGEQRYTVRPRMMRMGVVAGSSEALASTPVSPGEIEIRSTVTVSFRIE